MVADTAFTIAITTKDRAAHLAETVNQLKRTAPAAVELLVIDDGSATPVTPETWGKLPFPVRLIRHPAPQGYIVSRNELARACRTPFLLSCDDDSHPIAGDVGAAASYLASHPELIALSFPYLQGPARKPMNPTREVQPYRVRQFIGCSHMLRVDYFLQLGGYWEWLVQQNEERDLCYRALLRGWSVAHFPGVTFFHDYTPAGRNWDRHHFYTIRNEMRVELLRIPWAAALVKLVRNGLLALAWTLKQRRACHVRGYLAGLSVSSATPGRLNCRQYQTFLARPWA